MYGSVDEASGLTAMQTAGARWVTTILHWSTVEPDPPLEGVHSYDWTAFDDKVSNAQATGLKVFVLIAGNPAWAAACPGGALYEERVPDMTAFVTALAERYDGDRLADAPGNPVVNDWSFYSEPDNGEEWRCYEQGRGYWGYNGAGYAELLFQISPALHSANPNARLMIGGIAYDWFTDDTPTPGPFVRSFLGDTLQALNDTYGGAGNFIDAVAFHFYPISTWRWPTIREKTSEIQGILEQHGVGELPLLVPEMGYWSAEEAGSSETRQAQYLAQTYVRGLSAGIEHLSWLGVFDDGEGTEEHGLFWGRDLDNPKMAYDAYATLASELASARYAYPLAAPGAEGYLFTLPDGGEKTVLWSVLDPSTWVAFTQSCLRQVDLTGLAQDVQDGGPLDGDGAADGQIQLQVFFEQPVYVGTCD